MTIKMTRTEMQASLRAERLSATQRLIALRREIEQRQAEIDQVESRIEDINQAEGLL